MSHHVFRMIWLLFFQDIAGETILLDLSDTRFRNFSRLPDFSSSISRSIIRFRDSMKPPASVIEPRYLPVILRARFFSLSYTMLHPYNL